MYVESEVLVLALTAASIGVVHTLLGPDHYLPFIVLGRARSWTRGKTLAVAALCGLGHVAGSLVVGLLGIGLGLAVSGLEAFEGWRGGLAAWAVLGFGVAYMIWGLRRARTGKPHVHVHFHADGTSHAHTHMHRDAHSHVHEAPARAALTPWVLFMIFVLGPCEPLIPLLMVPASAHSWGAAVMVSAVFALSTLATMLSIVMAGLAGLDYLPLKKVERYTHAFAGAAVAACGGAMVFLGV